MNEFYSFLWLALFLLTAAAGKYSAEQKKTSLKKFFLILVLLSGFSFLWIYACCRFQGSLWTCSAILPPVFLAGMSSAIFGRLASDRRKLRLFELAGAALSAIALFFFADTITERVSFFLISSAFLFFVLEISLFLFPAGRKAFHRVLFIFFMASLLTVLLYFFYISSSLCCVRPAGSPAAENDFQRQITVLSGLQPDKRAIRVLLLSSPGALVESMSSFPLTNKLTHLPLSDSADPFRLLARCAFNYDLILLMPPEPGTFSANRLYTPFFFISLKNHLAPDGVLGVIVPEFSGAQYRKDRLFEIRGIVAATLRQLFPKVRLAPGSTYLLFCGSDNVSNDLPELNERAASLLANLNYLPDDLLLLLNTTEELEQRNRSFSEYSVTAKDNRSFPPPLLAAYLRGTPEIDRTPLGAITDFYRRAAVFWGVALVVFWLLLRYFLSGGLKKKRACLTFENGFFAGGMFAAALLLLQVKTATLYSDGWLLAAVFFIFTFWGLSLSGKSPSFSRGVFLLSAVLPPLVLGSFCVPFPGQELIPFPVTAATGFCLGQSSGDIRGRASHLFFGFSVGIVFLVLSIFPFYGLWFCAGVLILTRIPGIVTKNMKKEFDFSRFQPKIQEKEF